MTPPLDGTNRRQDIRRFLMAKRAAIPPETVGLPGGSRRRTPGLRREEVASLAGVGITWYTWFEQGRDIRLSADALKRIACALRLTSSDAAYLFSLAEIPISEKEIDWAKIGDDLLAVLDGFRAGPALVVSPIWNVQAYNRLADILFEFEEMEGLYARNHIWRLFMDPVRRAKYLGWEQIAQEAVGVLRLAHGRMLGDPFLGGLIRDLVEKSDVFRRLWEAQTTVSLEPMTFGLRVPPFGSLFFTSVRFRPVSGSDLMLVVGTPADEMTSQAMQELSSRHLIASRVAG